MAANPGRKNKVNLSDYNYRDDIDNRLMLSDFSLFEVEVLKEVLDHSLTISVDELLETFDVKRSTLQPVLDKISQTRLLTSTGDTLVVDKERRKYFEGQIGKFDDDSVPGFDFLFGLLRKVPIHALPDWYAIPRTSNDIFQSIVEHYLSTPKIYERYLAELILPESAEQSIMQEVFASADYKVSGAKLRKKYKLSREQFEETLLKLEFNFICCLGYNRSGDRWEEVVTPFREWRDYLLFLRDTQPKTIGAVSEIKSHASPDFSFVKDLSALLRALEQGPVTVEEGSSISAKAIAAWMPQLSKGFHLDIETYLRVLVDRALRLQLAEVRGTQIVCSSAAKEWHKKSPQDQALMLYRLPLSDMKVEGVASELLSERSLREVERGLKRVANSGWVYFDEFYKSLTVPIGNLLPVILKQTGKRWRYDLPQYGVAEAELVRWAISQRLFEGGMVALGQHKQRLCLCVTAFGRMAMGN